MKTISLWQPWASLMALGLKKNETRHWPTGYRGPLLIHAAKRKMTKAEFKRMRYILDYYSGDQSLYGLLCDLPYGAILCQVTLTDCQKVSDHNYPGRSSLESHLGDYSAGRFIWITSNLKKFKEPIPFRGSQGFFNVPDEVANQKIHLTEKRK